MSNPRGRHATDVTATAERTWARARARRALRQSADASSDLTTSVLPSV